MDDNKIRILLAAIRTGSFSRAAQEMNCTQSAVTQAMICHCEPVRAAKQVPFGAD